jgi:hypothetical protein
MTQGMRRRSQDLATQVLGYRSEREIVEARGQSVERLQFTELDRVLVRHGGGAADDRRIVPEVAGRAGVQQERSARRDGELPPAPGARRPGPGREDVDSHVAALVTARGGAPPGAGQSDIIKAWARRRALALGPPAARGGWRRRRDGALPSLPTRPACATIEGPPLTSRLNGRGNSTFRKVTASDAPRPWKIGPLAQHRRPGLTRC